MKSFVLSPSCELVIREADITQLEVDAIVNAANEAMLGGGGVDGAIHRAAGPELLAACYEVEESRPGVRCPTGEARLTPGFALPAQWVIHTVGPVYRSPAASAPLLESAYRASLEVARSKSLHSIAFPAISCGVYRYPLTEASSLALKTCSKHAGELRKIVFALFGADAHRAWLDAAEELFPSSSSD